MKENVEDNLNMDTDTCTRCFLRIKKNHLCIIYPYIVILVSNNETTYYFVQS